MSFCDAPGSPQTEKEEKIIRPQKGKGNWSPTSLKGKGAGEISPGGAFFFDPHQKTPVWEDGAFIIKKRSKIDLRTAQLSSPPSVNNVCEGKRRNIGRPR